MAVLTVKDIVMRLLDVVDTVKEHIPDSDYMQVMNDLKDVHDNVKENNAPGYVTYKYHSQALEKCTQDIATLKKQYNQQADKIKELMTFIKSLDGDEFYDAHEDIPIAHPIPSAPPAPVAPPAITIDANFADRPPYINNRPSKCIYMYKKGKDAGKACGDTAVCYRARHGKGPAIRGSCLYSVCSKHVNTVTFSPLSDHDNNGKFLQFLGPDPLGNGMQEYVVGV